MNAKILLYIAMMFLGLYVMPNSLALFAGQHTFISGTSVSCEKCHSDILSQIEASGYVYEKHKGAAGNTNYTTYLSLGGVSYSGGAITGYNGKVWTWNSAQSAWQNGSDFRNVSLDKNGNGINGAEICMLCHNSTLTGSSVHTGVVVRVCDDDRCHGNKNYYYNSPDLLGSRTKTTAAGYFLGQNNAHQPFYLETSNQSSSYGELTGFGQTGNANNGFISKGHWTCEGCHTESVINISLTFAPTYDHSESNPEKRRYD